MRSSVDASSNGEDMCACVHVCMCVLLATIDPEKKMHADPVLPSPLPLTAREGRTPPPLAEALSPRMFVGGMCTGCISTRVHHRIRAPMRRSTRVAKHRYDDPASQEPPSSPSSVEEVDETEDSGCEDAYDPANPLFPSHKYLETADIAAAPASVASIGRSMHQGDDEGRPPAKRVKVVRKKDGDEDDDAEGEDDEDDDEEEEEEDAEDEGDDGFEDDEASEKGKKRRGRRRGKGGAASKRARGAGAKRGARRGINKGNRGGGGGGGGVHVGGDGYGDDGGDDDDDDEDDDGEDDGDGGEGDDDDAAAGDEDACLHLYGTRGRSSAPAAAGGGGGGRGNAPSSSTRRASERRSGNSAGSAGGGGGGGGGPFASNQIAPSKARLHKCWLCTFSGCNVAKRILEFVSANAGTMDPVILADQIKREVRRYYPHAIGIERGSVLRHMREHILLPNVRMASIVRSLIGLAETLRGTLHQIDDDTGDVMVDVKNAELYLKVINQIHSVYKTDGTRMLFGIPSPPSLSAGGQDASGGGKSSSQGGSMMDAIPSGPGPVSSSNASGGGGRHH